MSGQDQSATTKQPARSGMIGVMHYLGYKNVKAFRADWTAMSAAEKAEYVEISDKYWAEQQ